MKRTSAAAAGIVLSAIIAVGVAAARGEKRPSYCPAKSHVLDGDDEPAAKVAEIERLWDDFFKSATELE